MQKKTKEGFFTPALKSSWRGWSVIFWKASDVQPGFLLKHVFLETLLTELFA